MYKFPSANGNRQHQPTILGNNNNNAIQWEENKKKDPHFNLQLLVHRQTCNNKLQLQVTKNSTEKKKQKQKQIQESE